MEIKELKEKIDTLVNDAKELKVIAEKMMEEKEANPKRFIPKKGEKYFYIDNRGEVLTTLYDTENLMDIYNIQTRNCFRTEEEAEEYNHFIDIESRLRDLADELEENNVLNYYLYYNEEGIVSFWSNNIYPQISCKNNNFAIIALERIGFEDLKFYLTYKR